MGIEIAEKVKNKSQTSQHVKHTEISIWTQMDLVETKVKTVVSPYSRVLILKITFILVCLLFVN